MVKEIPEKGLVELLDGSTKCRTLDFLFKEVINIRRIHHHLEMNESTIRALQKKFNYSGSFSVEKMSEAFHFERFKCSQE